MFDGNFREGVAKATDPVGRGLNSVGITADVLTVVGVLMAGVAAWVIAQGELFWGFVLMLAAAVPDLLDGPVAKAAGTTSNRGAFFDSSMDRVSDALIFIGIAWYLDVNEPGRIVILPMAIMAAAMVTSYLRAKGELLGYDAKGGLMERAERYIAISVGLVFSDILIPVLWIMFALICITIVQRFFKIWRQATAEMRQPEPISG
ncbi:MAG: CDP-alcohol phosphatidyltransferase family protein [Actinomycetota bacterium]